MKKIILLMMIMGSLFSCEKTEPLQPTNELVVIDMGNNTFQISGNFTENYILTNDKRWYLSGGVFVKDGVTLTIEEGTTIYAAVDNTTPFLSILQGGKLFVS